MAVPKIDDLKGERSQKWSMVVFISLIIKACKLVLAHMETS